MPRLRRSLCRDVRVAAGGLHRRAEIQDADRADDRQFQGSDAGRLQDRRHVAAGASRTTRSAAANGGEIFGDPELDTLEDQLTASNQNLKIADARFREARAMIGYQRASEFPTIRRRRQHQLVAGFGDISRIS